LVVTGSLDRFDGADVNCSSRPRRFSAVRVSRNAIGRQTVGVCARGPLEGEAAAAPTVTIVTPLRVGSNFRFGPVLSPKLLPRRPTRGRLPRPGRVCAYAILSSSRRAVPVLPVGVRFFFSFVFASSSPLQNDYLFPVPFSAPRSLYSAVVSSFDFCGLSRIFGNNQFCAGLRCVVGGGVGGGATIKREKNARIAIATCPKSSMTI